MAEVLDVPRTGYLGLFYSNNPWCAVGASLMAKKAKTPAAKNKSARIGRMRNSIVTTTSATEYFVPFHRCSGGLGLLFTGPP